LTTEQEGIQTLMKLGLTATQAKVYFTLLGLEKATGKMISKQSNVARQEAYRILAELTEKGLILKRIANPTEFEPISIEDCLNILIERKKKEISETQKNSTKLLQKLKVNNLKGRLQEEEPVFVLVPEKGNFLHRIKKSIANSQTNIDLIMTLTKFHFIISIIDEEIKKALKRGVNVRIIIEKTADGKLLPNIAKALEQNPLFRIRNSLTFPQAKFLVIDHSRVIMVTSERKDFADSPTLWTNNQVLLRIVQEYFETQWNSAAESNPQTPSDPRNYERNLP
jgi:sugar-specific transcriptional regulator TrmB